MTYKPCFEPQTLVLVSLLVVGTFFFSNAYADVNLGSTTIQPKVPLTKYNLLVIEYSQSCRTVLSHNLTTSCPTLDKIWSHDTTNTQISGKLVESKGVFYRSAPQVKNHYIWYASHVAVCVDCSIPVNIYGLVKTIFIEPSNFTFYDRTQVVTNSTFITQSKIYISPDCKTSTIGYTEAILNDTINYMLNNCTGPHLSNSQINTIKQTPFTFDNPYSSLHYQKQVQQLKASTVKNCITAVKKCEPVKDPYKKVAWGKYEKVIDKKTK